eukprot:8384696-Pyramimonas_sp.AAC.1
MKFAAARAQVLAESILKARNQKEVVQPTGDASRQAPAAHSEHGHGTDPKKPVRLSESVGSALEKLARLHL